MITNKKLLDGYMNQKSLMGKRYEFIQYIT